MPFTDWLAHFLESAYHAFSAHHDQGLPFRYIYLIYLLAGCAAGAFPILLLAACCRWRRRWWRRRGGGAAVAVGGEGEGEGEDEGEYRDLVGLVNEVEPLLSSTSGAYGRTPKAK